MRYVANSAQRAALRFLLFGRPFTACSGNGGAGSRSVGDEDVTFAESIVRKVNSNGFGVVSGGTCGGTTEALKREYCPVLCRDNRRYPGNTDL